MSFTTELDELDSVPVSKLIEAWLIQNGVTAVDDAAEYISTEGVTLERGTGDILNLNTSTTELEISTDGLTQERIEEAF